jgi:hypothetical protein
MPRSVRKIDYQASYQGKKANPEPGVDKDAMRASPPVHLAHAVLDLNNCLQEDGPVDADLNRVLVGQEALQDPWQGLDDLWALCANNTSERILTLVTRYVDILD